MRRNHTHNVARYRKCVKKNVKRRVRLEDVEVQLADQDVVYAIDSPLKPTDGILVIKGNLAPDGAVLKSSGVTIRQHRGPARVFEKEETALQAILEGQIAKGDVWSSATRGRRAGPACARCWRSPPPSPA